MLSFSSFVLLLLLILLPSSIGDIMNISISINCDNHCHVYINGMYQIENYDWSHSSVSNTTINIDNDVIGVSLMSWSGLCAFRSVIDVINSNKRYSTNAINWKCINSKPFDNWNTNDYDDSQWPSATSYGNGSDIWGDLDLYGAEWISSNDIANNNVLCRYKPLSTHGDQCSVVADTGDLVVKTLPKLLVVIPGFGRPELDIKIRILRENMKKLKSSTSFSSISYHIFQYDTEFEMPVDIVNDPMVTITVEEGILGQFLHKYSTPNYVYQYDFILILLDDVEIIDVSWNELIMMKKLVDYDVASCCLKEGIMSFWDFTRHLPNKNVWIREQSICELFCYFMDAHTYEKYYEFIDYDNPWMWGMDMIMKSKMNLNCAVFNNFVSNHYIRGGHTNVNASRDMNNYLSKYNTSWEQEEKQIKIKRIITTP